MLVWALARTDTLQGISRRVDAVESFDDGLHRQHSALTLRADNSDKAINAVRGDVLQQSSDIDGLRSEVHSTVDKLPRLLDGRINELRGQMGELINEARQIASECWPPSQTLYFIIADALLFHSLWLLLFPPHSMYKADFCRDGPAKRHS